MQFVKPVPFTEAIDKLGDRTPIGSALNSTQWGRVPVALRERAFFSSEVESVRFLQRGKDAVADFLQGSREQVTGPDGVTRTALKTGSRAQFVRDMSKLAAAEGLGPLEPKDAGTIKDITSQKRLSLIFDTQTRQAHDYGNWKQGMDPDVLAEFPAQRFVREREVKEERAAHTIYEDAVQLKSNTQFWQRINTTFGVPWGPWGWGCGHGVEDVDRDEAERLGLLGTGQAVQPVEKDFNERLEASTKNLDPEFKAQLKETFGDQIEFVGDNVRWRGDRRGVTPRPQPAPQPPTEPERPAGRPTLEEALVNSGIAGKETVTEEEITKFVEELKEERPVEAERVVGEIRAPASGMFSKSKLQADLQEFLNFVPAEKVLNRVPKLRIALNSAKDEGGHYSPSTKTVVISKATVGTAEERRRVMFHELMHWLHMEGSEEFKKAIRDHFAKRTEGEIVGRLPGYSAARGKTDKWYEAYAGRVYPFEGKVPQGLEVPTRYIEWLTMDAKRQALLWNDKDFRETMLVVLKALFL